MSRSSNILEKKEKEDHTHLNLRERRGRHTLSQKSRGRDCVSFEDKGRRKGGETQIKRRQRKIREVNLNCCPSRTGKNTFCIYGASKTTLAKASPGQVSEKGKQGEK